MKDLPWILIAGWAYPASALMDLRNLLPGSALAVALPELRAAGRAMPSTARVLSTYAQGLRALIAQQGGQAVVLGWSMGGMVALETASYYPQMIRGLVLMASTPKFCAADDFAPGIPSSHLRALQLGLRRNRAQALAGFYQLAAAPWPALPAPPEPLADAAWQDELAAGLDYLQRTDLRPGLSGIGASVLILQGREDRVVPWQAAAFINRQLPRSRLCLYANQGHDLPQRSPGQLLADLRCFLV
ncbi:MAG: alpha/beta fold hydrolase [Lentisphaerae bacterium]|nr:alpha/beta fold hydrolase [Lentisphaerota bacterium]